MNIAMKMIEWCANALFALSPEKRRLLRSIKQNVASMGSIESEEKMNLEAVTKNSFDRYTLRMIDKYSYLRPPFALVALLEAAQLPGDPRRLTELEEKHFTISREINELEGNVRIKIGSYLSPEAMTIYRESKVIKHYLLYNPDEWDLAYPLLRDRHLWDLDQLMEGIEMSRSIGPITMAEGAL